MENILKDTSIIDTTLHSIFTDYNSDILSKREKDDLLELFRPIAPSSFQCFSRLAFHEFSTYAPVFMRLFLLRHIRKLRNRGRTAVISTKRCRFNLLVQNLDEGGLSRHGYRGKKASVCLSYDVDRDICHNSLEKITQLLECRHLTATFNILTNWEYEVDWQKIIDMKKSGFEIGLHGGEHDIALGYRPMVSIAKKIKKAKNKSQCQYFSYRAPALCMTPNLLGVIQKSGFQCDSSLPMSNMYYKSVESCFPYPLDTNGHLWELPVSIQDSTVFLDMELNEQDAGDYIIKLVDEIIEIGGVAVINLHPYIIHDHPEFHIQLLNYLVSLEDVWICTQSDIIRNVCQVAKL